MMFTLVGRDNLSRAFRQAGLSARRLKKDLIGVGATAAIPATAAGAAGAVALAGAVASAGAAVIGFTAAVIPQAKAMGEVSKAQKKWREEVAESGATSQKAAEAQLAYSKAAAKLPAGTREAAAGFLVLGDAYKDWSDSLAGDTMPVLTKSFATFQGLLPRMTPLVKGASVELDRLMTILAGGVASDGFGKLMDQFAEFSSGSLRKATDGLVHFMRVMQGFDPAGGALGKFIAYARENGPVVADTFRNLALALANVLQAGSGLGVTMLGLVNSLAKLVAAIPPDVLATVLQLYLAFRLLSTAAAGVAALGVASRALGLAWMRMSIAATGATGAMAGLRAAFLALGTAARASVIVAGIALLVVGLSKLANIGRAAPPDIDKLAASLARLGHSGKVGGEAARVFGKDLDGLFDKLNSYTAPSVVDNIQQGLVKVLSLGITDSSPKKDAKKALDALDESLAKLVQGGKADLAAAALQRLKTAYAKGGGDVSKFTRQLDDYEGAIADAAFEQQLAAQAMGLFGAQASKAAQKLAEQKASADGLRQAIQALNDVQRAGLGGMIGFEAAIDAAAKAAKENAGSLDMVGGRLNLNGEKARNAATALQDLASKTDEAAASARESGASWQTVSGIYARGRAELVRWGQVAGLSKGQAEQLAASILKIPDKKTTIEMDREDALGGLDAVIAKIKATPGAKSVKVTTLSESAIRVLEQVGFKVKQLPDGSFTVTAKTGTASANLAALKRQADAIKNKTVNIDVWTHYKTTGSPYRPVAKDDYRARGGIAPGYASGGDVQAFPWGGLIRGPGTSTSDSILTMFASGAMGRTSDREYVVRAAAVKKYGVSLFDDLNAMRLAGGGLVGYASGGAVRKDVAGDLAALIRVLAKGPDEIRQAAKALIEDLRKLGAAGKKWAARVDVNSTKLITLSKRSEQLAERIREAKQFATDVQQGAVTGAALSGLPGAAAPTGARLLSGLKGRLDRIRQFAALIKKLAARGLSKSLLRQIIEMGPEDGYRYAQALMAADSATFRGINAAQASIEKEAKKLGRSSADLLYDAGKQAGKGFLAGLRAQRTAIEKLMLNIAKAMQKAIKAALGIKSPSTVMAGLGRQTTRGLAVGLVDAMPHLDGALKQVSDRVASTRPAMLPVRIRQPVRPQLAMAGAASGLAAGGGGDTVTNNYSYTAHITQTVMSDAQIHGAFGRMEVKHRMRRAK